MSLIRSLFIFALFILLLTATGLYGITKYSRIAPYSISFFEKTSPTITWIEAPKGLGADPASLAFEVDDSGAGLDEVVVRINQKNNPKELLRQSFEPGAYSSGKLYFTVNSKDLALREGRAQITVSAFDKSMWSNGNEISLELPVSFVKPRVEVLTSQHNAVLGGSELVFFRFVGNKLTQSGITSGKVLSKGFQAGAIDAGFKSYPSIYFSFFPVPITSNPDSIMLKAFASDMFGNVDEKSFNYRIKNTKIQPEKIDVSDEFIAEKIEELSSNLPKEVIADKTPQEIFKLINEELRKANEEKLRSVLSESAVPCYWKGIFYRPLTVAPKSTFGEMRSYVNNGTTISNSLHLGVDLADVANSKVTASQNGKVVYAGDLGVYGTVLAIDHGCGISSFYAHLSQTQVIPGQEVKMGDRIGTTGTTGLAMKDHLHFEIRINGTPVSPFEWWDPTWMKDHVEQKIRSVQQELIGTPGE